MCVRKEFGCGSDMEERERNQGEDGLLVSKRIG